MLPDTALSTPAQDEYLELGEIASIYSGGTPSKKEPNFWQGNLPWLSGKDLKSFRVSDSIDHVSEGAVGRGTRAVPAGATLVLVRGMQLFKSVPIALTMKRVTFNQDVKAVVGKENVDPVFLAYALLARVSQLSSSVTAAGHGTGRLATEALETLPIWVPPLPEQRRVATVIGVWDDAIGTTERLAEVKRKRFCWLQAELLTGQNALGPSTCLGDYFVPRRQPGEVGLPLLSVTMNDGVVARNLLDRRSESAMDEEAHLLVAPGDIAYNMMRMWQGASGLCRVRGNISPAYVVMTPKPNLDAEFVAHWLKSKGAIDLLWAYSHGLTEDRLRLYPDDFLKIPARLPPLPEQRKIAHMLDEGHQDAVTAERLVAALRNQKRGLMQLLLTGKLRVPETIDNLMPSMPAMESAA